LKTAEEVFVLVCAEERGQEGTPVCLLPQSLPRTELLRASVPGAGGGAEHWAGRFLKDVQDCQSSSVHQDCNKNDVAKAMGLLVVVNTIIPVEGIISALG
jgi:hypothetical protein